MKIIAIETIPVRVPIREHLAIRAKGGTHSVSPFLLVRIHTDEGLTGLGEVSCTPRWSGEDQVTAAHFIRTILSPLLIGKDPRDIEHASLLTGRALLGHPFTKAALEMAMWDILGKAAGLPVYRLLGKQGLATDEMPPAGQPIMHTIGYQMHAGKHGTIPSDWDQFLKFMEMHLQPGKQ